MINLTGSINLVTDLQTAIFALQSSRVIYIGELNPQIPQDYFITYSNLLPPYEALDAEIDGNMELYNQIYFTHLTQNEYCFQAFATILVALFKGVNVTLYIENGNSLAHAQFLLNYMQRTFGIICGTQQNMFAFDPNYSAQTAIILYSFLDGFITLPDLLTEAPIQAIIEMSSIPFINPLEKAAREEHVDLSIIIPWLAAYQNRLSIMVTAPQDGNTSIIRRIKED